MYPGKIGIAINSFPGNNIIIMNSLWGIFVYLGMSSSMVL